MIAFVVMTTMIGCGGTNTKTVVTVESHTTTVVSTQTVTTTVPARPRSTPRLYGHSATTCGSRATLESELRSNS